MATQKIESNQVAGILPGDPAMMVFGETPTGLVNNSNAIFHTQFDFVPGTVVLKINGLTQFIPDDYNTSGVNQITCLVSPQVGDKVRVDYIKQ